MESGHNTCRAYLCIIRKVNVVYLLQNIISQAIHLQELVSFPVLKLKA